VLKISRKKKTIGFGKRGLTIGTVLGTWISRGTRVRDAASELLTRRYRVLASGESFVGTSGTDQSRNSANKLLGRGVTHLKDDNCQSEGNASKKRPRRGLL